MTARILYLFPDTNVFVQCKPLDQINWSVWSEFDEVHLIVSRPVQSEIDNQKNKGSDRLGKRARAASSLFREIIVGVNGHRVVRDSGPTVKLLIRPELRPSTEIAPNLDYQECDDQLVGIAYGFRDANPLADVRVLTHDTGPMATARMVGLDVAPVPDEWLVPPESTDAERKINALEGEVARLRKAEPQFNIVCLDRQGVAVRVLELEPAYYEAVSDEELAELMGRIKERFPLETDFGGRDAVERDLKMPGLSILGMKEYFTPAREEDIAAYRDEKYPPWLTSCEEMLRNYHSAQQQRAGAMTFTFAISNDGARPAKDALVTFEARGKFEIMPPPYREKDEAEDRAPPELPRPPAAPTGKWQSGTAGQRHALEMWERMNRSVASAISPLSQHEELFRAPPMPNIGARRDPNAFFYKPDRARFPGASFSLECEQWRHGIDPEYFTGEIHFDPEEGQIAGAIECTIHAENLSDPVTMTLPVRIKVRRVRAHESAKTLVDNLVLRPRGLNAGGRRMV